MCARVRAGGCWGVCEPCFLWGVWECVSPLSLLRSVWLPPSGRWRSGTAEARASRQEVRNLSLKNGCNTHILTWHARTMITNVEGQIIPALTSVWKWINLEFYNPPCVMWLLGKSRDQFGDLSWRHKAHHWFTCCITQLVAFSQVKTIPTLSCLTAACRILTPNFAWRLFLSLLFWKGLKKSRLLWALFSVKSLQRYMPNSSYSSLIKLLHDSQECLGGSVLSSYSLAHPHVKVIWVE